MRDSSSISYVLVHYVEFTELLYQFISVVSNNAIMLVCGELVQKEILGVIMKSAQNPIQLLAVPSHCDIGIPTQISEACFPLSPSLCPLDERQAVFSERVLYVFVFRHFCTYPEADQWNNELKVDIFHVQCLLCYKYQ